MKAMDQIYQELCKPFPVTRIKWRVGNTWVDNKTGGKMTKPLCYIDARDVMDRLDQVVGPSNWQREYLQLHGETSICRIGILCPVYYSFEKDPPAYDWVWKSDGAGETNIEGEKGGMSDAFKRAAVNWGIGRYLYHLKTEPVLLENDKFISKATVKQLNEYYEDTCEGFGWGVEEPKAAYIYRTLLRTIESFVHDDSDSSEFLAANQGLIECFPANMRRDLYSNLEKISGKAPEKASRRGSSDGKTLERSNTKSA